MAITRKTSTRKTAQTRSREPAGEGTAQAKAVDAYLARLSPEKRSTLERVRKAIHAAAPKAEQGMSYGMPAFIQGKPIAGYAASTSHCAYYPMSGAVVAALRRELEGYDTSKGAIRFPIGKPLPPALIRKLVKARLAELEDAAATKRTATKKSAKEPGRKASAAAKTTARTTTVDEYLAGLPHDRREALEAVRAVILDNLDADYEEGIQHGMIGYYVPHRIFPAGYHADPEQPLPFAALASQKNHMALYLMGLYVGSDGDSDSDHSRWFREAWTTTGRKLDMGKSCVRFRRLEDVPLEVVGEAIRRIPARAYVRAYQAARGKSR